MNKMKTILWNHMYQYRVLYLFTIILFIIGIIIGSVIVNSMTFIQKQEVYFHLEQFFYDIQDDFSFTAGDIMKRSYLSHVNYLLFFFLFGITIIGIPLIWLFIVMKGVFIGFSVGFVVNQLGWNGLFIALLSIAPQNLVIVPIYIIGATLSMAVSIRLIRQIFGKQQKLTIRHVLKQYVAIYCILLLGAFIASVVETFLSRYLLIYIL